MSNIVTAYTALSPEVLKFRSMVGNERLSSLFEFRVELVSSSASLDLKSLLGKSLSMQVQLEAGGDRYLDGQVVSFEFCGRETSTSRSYIYAATLRPWLWYLTLNSDCRIFQDMTVVEIVQQVLAKYGFPVQTRLTATYRQWSYCVQYQESDFAFVSRWNTKASTTTSSTRRVNTHWCWPMIRVATIRYPVTRRCLIRRRTGSRCPRTRAWTNGTRQSVCDPVAMS
jgi:uncharacterized protein involved in type VI secretion and phage assembly